MEINEIFEMFEKTADEYVETKPEMTADELRQLGGKIVKAWEVPDGARYIGGYFEPYHDVTVYEKDGEYYHVYFYIGD